MVSTITMCLCNITVQVWEHVDSLAEQSGIDRNLIGWGRRRRPETETPKELRGGGMGRVYLPSRLGSDVSSPSGVYIRRKKNGFGAFSANGGARTSKKNVVYRGVYRGVYGADLPSLPHLAGDSRILEPSPAHPPHY